jgi:predicted DNA-binding transcriptional regulator AlpA
MTPDRPLSRRALAEQKLGRTVAWTYRNLPRLIRDRGFPAPYLPNTWSEAAVDAWIARESWGGTMDTDIEVAGAGTDSFIAEQLDDAARRIAAGLAAR